MWIIKYLPWACHNARNKGRHAFTVGVAHRKNVSFAAILHPLLPTVVLSLNKSQTDYKQSLIWRVGSVRDSRPAAPEQSMERLPAALGLFLCSSHGGSLAVIDGDHNPTLNALQVKFQQEPRLFTQEEWFHGIDLTLSKRAVSAQRSWSNPELSRRWFRGWKLWITALFTRSYICHELCLSPEDRASPQSKRSCLF